MSAIPRPASCACPDFGEASAAGGVLGASASFTLDAGAASPSADVVVVDEESLDGGAPLAAAGAELADG